MNKKTALSVASAGAILALVIFVLAKPDAARPYGQQSTDPVAPRHESRGQTSGLHADQLHPESEMHAGVVEQRATPRETPGAFTLKVVDESNQPVAGVVGKARWNQGAGEGGGPAPATFMIGGDGTCDVPCQAGAHSARLFVDEGRWAQFDYSPFDPGAAGEVLLRVYSRHTLRLSIRYADGEPYEGIVSMTHDEKASAHATAGMAEIPGVAARDAWVMADTGCGGFQSLVHELKASQITSGQRIDVTLERGKHVGGFVTIKASRVPGDVDPLVRIPYQISHTGRDLDFRDGSIQFIGEAGSKKIGPVEPGRYVVHASFGSYSAKADFDLTAEDDRTVELAWEASGSVTAEIIQADGTPLAGAVLRTKFSDLPTYSARDREGRQAVADDKGVACLSGLAAGNFTLFAEAMGFDPTPVEVVVLAGVNISAGRVVLKRATARMTVEVLNAKEAGYEVELGGPVRFRSIAREALGKSGMVVMETIPAREYRVAVLAETGLCVKQCKIDLTKRQSDDVHIVFDLSDPDMMSHKSR